MQTVEYSRYDLFITLGNEIMRMSDSKRTSLELGGLGHPNR
jgi:hypothetical protein